MRQAPSTRRQPARCGSHRVPRFEPLESRVLFCDWGWLEATSAERRATVSPAAVPVRAADYQHGGALHVEAATLAPMGPQRAASASAPAPARVVTATGTVMPTGTVSLPPGTTTLRIETGGSSSFTDSAGRTWSADSGFSGGTVSVGSYPVANTSDDRLYYTRRWGNFTYSRAVGNGLYTLRLHFADPLYSRAGYRRFDAFAEGAQILNDFDIAANGGGRAALVKSFTVGVTDGRLDLSFGKVLENPILSAVELLPAGTAEAPKTAPPAPADVRAVPGAGRVTLSWTDRSNSELGFRIERKETLYGSYKQLATVGPNATGYVDTASLKSNVDYFYRVRSYNSVGASGPSNEAGPVRVSANPLTTWRTGAASPITRAEAARGVVGDKLYVFGGYYNAAIQATRRCDVYDPAANRWTRIADMPVAMTHQGMVVEGTTIWLVGGYVGDHPGPASTMVFKYDTATNRWSRGPDLPEPRGAGAAAMVGRRIYFFGGMERTRRTDMGTTWVLDLDDRSGAGWRRLPDMPNPRNHLTGVAFDGKVYAIGGHWQQDHEAVTQDEVDVFDPSANAWKRVADTPFTPRSQTPAATVVWKDRIIVVGGADDTEHSTTRISAYTPGLDRWQDIGYLPAARRAAVAAIINNRLIVTTGNDPYPSTTTWISGLLE